MRQIFPVGRPIGDGRLPERVGPHARGEPGVDRLVDELAAVYAVPGRLWVRANMVASVDGAVSADGRSGGLSGAADRLVFSVLRSLADVVVVGAGTARAERYRKVAAADVWPRLRAGRQPTPPVAVLTRRLDLDLGERLFGRAGADEAARTIVLTTRQAPADRVAAAARVGDVVLAGSADVTAGAAIDALARRGHRSILVEGGPAVLGQLVAAGLLDELCLTISPVLEGGRAPRAAAASGSAGRAGLTGLRLATVLEDDGFLLTRYLRAGADGA